jgi:hypothetical protein
MTREPTAAISWACRAAKEAMLLAIEAVDEVLTEIGSDDAAIEHPELVVAFMAFAGNAYHAAKTQYH